MTAQDFSLSPGYYLRLSRTAMACQFEILLRPQDRRFVGVAHAVLDEVDELEQQISVYRDSSELSQINRTAFLAPVAVEERLYGLLRLSRELGEETGGAFDITSGPLIRCWGFFERRGRLPEADVLAAARQVTGWDNIVFDDAACAVSFRREGVEVNLGSIGKGYALDRAAHRLRREGLGHFLIHAGHSSIVAWGNSNSGPGWEVSIRDPLDQQNSVGSVRLQDCGMSISGVGEQFFTADGRRFGHILDPRTGWPPQHNALCAVIAPRAARAEALSTAFFVMSRPEVQRYCDAHREVGTILIAAGQNENSQGNQHRTAPVCWQIALKQAETRL